jgi:hypothetical protein
MDSVVVFWSRSSSLGVTHKLCCEFEVFLCWLMLHLWTTSLVQDATFHTRSHYCHPLESPLSPYGMLLVGINVRSKRDDEVFEKESFQSTDHLIKWIVKKAKKFADEEPS